MPVLSMFYGIIVRMYYTRIINSTTCRVLVEFADFSAVLSISDSSVLTGSLLHSKLRLVEAWMEIHRDELMANWSLAVRGEEVFKVEPLR